jgi:hypothetical protein
MKTRNNRHQRYHRHQRVNRQRFTRRNKPDKDIRKNNFYLWANQKWIKEVPKTLPKELKYIRPLDNFKLIQDEMYRNMLTMVREYTHNSKTNTKVCQQMKNIQLSFQHLHTEPILRHISEFCHLYKELVNENNIYKFLGVFNQNEMIKWSLPIVWNIVPDQYTSGKLSAHIGSPSLSLYDYRFYLSDSVIEKHMKGVRLNTSTTAVIREEQEQVGGHKSSHSSASSDTTSSEGGPETKTIEYIKYKKRITNAFMRFINDVFTKCLGKDYEATHNIKAQDVYDIECTILSSMNMIDPRFDDSYANIYQSDKKRDKPPHLSGIHLKKNNHRHCDCVGGSDE